MVIPHMVERKMLNKIYKYGLLLGVVTFSFFSSSSTVLAVNYGSGLYNTGLYSASLPDTTPPDAPIAIPSPGVYNVTQTVTLTALGSDTIRYSTTEIPATCSSGTLYTGPITVESSKILYVRACDSLNNSSTSNFTYIISKKRTKSSGSSAALIAQFLEEQKALTEQPVLTTPLPITRTLKYKMTGDDVKSLQVYLNTHGYPVSTSGLGSTGKETSYFGPATKKAVILFQNANKLTADGIVGAMTRGKME